MSSSTRTRVLNLYKTMLHMGKEYPKGYDYFKVRLHGVFTRNKNETDVAKIEQMIKHGEFVIKELEALYMLKKYRTLKRRYYD